MNGGNYSIAGGFWGIIAAVQTPGAPLLAIRRTSTNTVAVSWPSPSTGFTLQQNTNGIADGKLEQRRDHPERQRDDQDGHCESAKRE